MDPAADGADRHVELLGDLLVGVPEHVPEDDGRPVLRSEVGQQTLEVVRKVAGCRLGIGRRRPLEHTVRVVGAGETLAAARELAAAYAALPPVAVRMSKQAINASAMPLGYATSFMDRDQFLLTRMDAGRD